MNKLKLLSIITIFIPIIILFSFPAYACTGIYGSFGDNVLVGNNEDWNDPCIKIWFLPAEDSKYGRVYLGYCNFFPQGGMNEKGLFFDGFATEPTKVMKSKNKAKCEKFLMEKVIEECATVDEALKVVDQYNLEFMEKCMFFIADAQGDSAIIEGDAVVRKDDWYQVCTNFYQSKQTAESANCWRYRKAAEMFDNGADLTVESFADILDAVHAEGNYATQYSNICDLKNKKIYLYLFHNFKEVEEIDLNEMLMKAPVYLDIPELFDENPEYEKFRYMSETGLEKQKSERIAKNADRSKWIDFVGKYDPPDSPEVPPDRLVTIELKDDKLFAYSDERVKVEILPEDDNKFFYLDVAHEINVEFIRDETGKVTHVYIETTGKKFKCKKIE